MYSFRFLGIRFHRVGDGWVYADDGGWIPGRRRALLPAILAALAYRSNPLERQMMSSASLDGRDTDSQRPAQGF